MSKDKELFSIKLNKQSQLLLKRLTGHANTLSVKNSMDLIGNQYRKEVELIFRKKQRRQPSLRWAKLAQSTLADKRRKGFGSKGILERTGNLRRGMSSKNHADNISKTGRAFGRFGSSNKYGNFHDDIKSPRKRLPLRNFSIPSEITFGVFLRIIEEDIKGQLEFLGIDIT